MTKKQSIDLSWFDPKKHQPYATHMSFIEVKEILEDMVNNQRSIIDNQRIIMSVINADQKFKAYVRKKKVSKPKTKVKEQSKIQQSVEESEIF